MIVVIIAAAVVVVVVIVVAGGGNKSYPTFCLNKMRFVWSIASTPTHYTQHRRLALATASAQLAVDR